MSAPAHTPGPWKVGDGSWVTSNAPVPEINGSDHLEFYGGHLIAESIAPQNRALIAAAPELLEALINLVQSEDEGEAAMQKLGVEPDDTDHPVIAAARAAIAKATGKEPS